MFFPQCVLFFYFPQKIYQRMQAFHDISELSEVISLSSPPLNSFKLHHSTLQTQPRPIPNQLQAPLTSPYTIIHTKIVIALPTRYINGENITNTRDLTSVIIAIPL
jgi:hypothetical protein